MEIITIDGKNRNVNPQTVPLSGSNAGAGVAGEGRGPGRSVGGQRFARRTLWGRQPLL